MTTEFVRNFDTPLIMLTGKDGFSLRDAFNGGIFCTGQPGAGKTSGPAKVIIAGLCRAGAGGCVFIVKKSELSAWKHYAQLHGREHDLVIFGDGEGINFLDYIFAVAGDDGANRATDALMSIVDSSDKAAGQGGGKKGEDFWQQSSRQMILYAVAALYGATGTVRIPDLIRFIDSAPTVKPPTREEQKSLQETNDTVKTLRKMQTNPARKVEQDLREASINYWLHQYPNLSPPTRSSIVITVTAKLNRFNTGKLRKAFCDKTTIVPEMTFAGKIILLNYPVLTMRHEGIVAQHLFSLLWMQAVEGRNALPPQFSERPVFFYADEAQFAIQPYLDLFLSVSRDCRASVILLTQSLATLYAQLGKDQSDFVDGLIGKFGQLLACLNSCSRTNKFWSELCGKGMKLRKQKSQSSTKQISTNRGGSETSTSQGYNRSDSSQEGSNEQEYEADLLPSTYFATQLKTGSAKNNFEVSAVWFKAGANFLEPIPETNNNILLATFTQK